MSVKHTPVGEYRELRAWVDGVLAALEEAETAAVQQQSPALRRALVRAAGYLGSVVDTHRIDDRGLCRTCRGILGLVRRPCRVVPLIASYILAPLPVAWWKVLVRQRKDVTLSQVCAWLGVDDAHLPYREQRHGNDGSA